MFSSRQGFIFAGNPPAPSGGDPYWDDVNIFLDGETLTDSSSIGHSVTNYGVSTSTSQVKYGTSSLYFDGSSRLEVGGTDIGAGTGDFTLDLWAYSTAVSGNAVFVESRTDGSTVGAYIFFADENGGVSNYVDTGFYIFQQDGTWNLNQWNHVAWSRSGTTSRLFINGTLVDTVTDSVDYSKDGFIVGSVIGGGAYFRGYMDNLRWTPGVCRYTSSFTPPTSSDYGP